IKARCCFRSGGCSSSPTADVLRDPDTNIKKGVPLDSLLLSPPETYSPLFRLRCGYSPASRWMLEQTQVALSCRCCVGTGVIRILQHEGKYLVGAGERLRNAIDCGGTMAVHAGSRLEIGLDGRVGVNVQVDGVVRVLDRREDVTGGITR